MHSDNYTLYGNTIEIRSNNKRMLSFIRNRLGQFYDNAKGRNPRIIISLTSNNGLPSSRPQYFCNKSLLLFIAHEYRVICNFYNYPWRIDIEYTDNISKVLREKSKGKIHLVYYYIFERALINALKRLGLSPMHAAAVEKNGHGIILLGPGGSGKTSSCLQLLRSGFKFVSDDQVFLKKTGAKVEMLSFLEKELFLTKKALSFFPYLESVKKATDHKKGHKNKKKISIDKLGFTDFKVKAYVKMVIFPRIDNKKESGMKPISNSELAIKMLRQAPREGKSIYQDPVSLNRQLELYSSLSSTAKGYDLVIGKNQNRIPKLILNRINGK